MKVCELKWRFTKIKFEKFQASGAECMRGAPHFRQELKNVQYLIQFQAPYAFRMLYVTLVFRSVHIK